MLINIRRLVFNRYKRSKHRERFPQPLRQYGTPCRDARAWEGWGTSIEDSLICNRWHWMQDKANRHEVVYYALLRRMWELKLVNRMWGLCGNNVGGFSRLGYRFLVVRFDTNGNLLEFPLVTKAQETPRAENTTQLGVLSDLNTTNYNLKRAPLLNLTFVCPL